MEQITIAINSVEQTIRLGEIIATSAMPSSFIALNGDLGAGKTTFTKGIGKALDVVSTVNSPTFTIMKIHKATKKLNNIECLYHLDVYRLQDSSSDFELEEFFYLDGLTVVEWCDIIQDLIPDDYLQIDFKIVEDEKRILTITAFNGATAWLKQITQDLEANKYEIIYG